MYILLRMVISFYLFWINTFLLSGLFHYPDRFLHHLLQKNEGQVYFKVKLVIKLRCCQSNNDIINSKKHYKYLLLLSVSYFRRFEKSIRRLLPLFSKIYLLRHMSEQNEIVQPSPKLKKSCFQTKLFSS